jgi:hypothetical protein
MAVLRKILGVLVILAGIGIFVAYEVLSTYIFPPVETDVTSIRRHQVPVGKTVIVSGQVSNYGTVWEHDAETGEFKGLTPVYELTVEQDGQEWSVKVMSDKELPEGEVVVVQGRLKANVHDVPGYVIEVWDAPSQRLLFLGASGTVVLVGVILLIGRRGGRVKKR